MRWVCLLVAASAAGCATVDPGHMGLMFNTSGLQRQPLHPGLYYVPPFSHMEDFDVTYSTKTEEIQTASSEGLGLALRVQVIYRPVAKELYELDSDIGLNYYDEVVGPEFRSAARGVFARHSYLELLRHNEDIENEIEADLRRRTGGKHVEVSSVTMEAIRYAPEIGKAVQDKLVAEQDALRQKTMLENEAARHKMELQSQADQEKMRSEAALRQKLQETELAKQEAALDKVRKDSEAEKRLIGARAEAEETRIRAEASSNQLKLLAGAHAAENKTLTPLAVMMRGYDALSTLGKNDAHIYLGDWSHLPNFLFPSTFAGLSAPHAESKPARTE